MQQPTGLDEFSILAAVDPVKDVDGLHPTNLGWLVLGKPAPLPCTPTGIIELLRRFDVPIAGAHVVVVGRGITVGRPLALMLTRRSENATVTVCHTGTQDLAAHVRSADIVVAAAGSPSLITADMVKPGAAVLDAGGQPRRRQDRGRRREGRRRGRGLAQPEPRRRRSDDPRDAADQCRRGSRADPRRTGLTWVGPRGRRSGCASRSSFLVVLIGLAAAFGYLLVQPGHWRARHRGDGGVVLAGRARPPRRCPSVVVGLLAVRSRWVDAICYLVFGGLILAVDIRLHQLSLDAG